jgi:hypothetical protein
MQIGRQSHQNKHRIDILCQLPLEPIEYCRRWVTQEPGRNYRKACINAIPRSGCQGHRTSYRNESKNCKRLGERFSLQPKYVTRILRQADLINQFKQLVAQEIINLPLDSPQE